LVSRREIVPWFGAFERRNLFSAYSASFCWFQPGDSCAFLQTRYFWSTVKWLVCRPILDGFLGLRIL
jgi:hypothetical protein